MPNNLNSVNKINQNVLTVSWRFVFVYISNRYGYHTRAMRFIYMLGVLSSLTLVTAKNLPKIGKNYRFDTVAWRWFFFLVDSADCD